MHVGKKFPSIFANPLIMREALHEKNFFIKLFYMQDILASHATHSSQSANNTNLPDFMVSYFSKFAGLVHLDSDSNPSNSHCFGEEFMSSEKTPENEI